MPEDERDAAADVGLGHIRALVAVDVPDDDTGEDSLLALIKSVPGNISLDSMLTEIRKLRAVRAVDLPDGLFADIAPRGLCCVELAEGMTGAGGCMVKWPGRAR